MKKKTVYLVRFAEKTRYQTFNWGLARPKTIITAAIILIIAAMQHCSIFRH
jgi:hypothetical protein